jgi:hypothetical protein
VAPFASADVFSITKSFDGGSQISVNLPVGLLLQVANPLAITLRTGYQALIVDGGGATHYVPLGLDAVLSPIRNLDLGAGFLFQGNLSGTGLGSPGSTYTNIWVASFWLRLRT